MSKAALLVALGTLGWAQAPPAPPLAETIYVYGDILGPDQRLSVLDALKSITLWAAWQHFEEDRKGSLAPGKLADFVILSASPLKVPPAKLRGLRVLETIKEGTSIYRAPAPSRAR